MATHRMSRVMLNLATLITKSYPSGYSHSVPVNWHGPDCPPVVVTHTHIHKRTDGRTDGRYQLHYLPRFAVDNNGYKHGQNRSCLQKTVTGERLISISYFYNSTQSYNCREMSQKYVYQFVWYDGPVFFPGSSYMSEYSRVIQTRYTSFGIPETAEIL